jgi:DNA-binding transcriptional LysR family regulator
MDLPQLEMFLAVMESGGYSKAGQNLHVSHSAIHRQVRILEHDIGAPLLIRNGRRVEPTEAGRLLASVAQRIRQEVWDAQRKINELNELQHGHLSIGTGSSILVFFLPKIIQQFRERFPGVEIYLSAGTADQVIEDVANRSLDLGIVFNPTDVLHDIPEIQHEILYTEEFDWAVGKHHPLSNRRRISLNDLAEFPLIMLPEKSHIRRVCERVFARNGLTPKITMELENEEAIDKLVEINAGIAPRSRHRARNTKIHCFEVPDNKIRTEVGMVYTATGIAHRAVKEFAQLCREAKISPAR